MQDEEPPVVRCLGCHQPDGSKRTHVGHGASCRHSLRVCRVPHGDEAHHCRRSALSWSVSWHRGIVRASGPDRLPRSATFFPARGRVERLRPRRRALLGLVHQQFQFELPIRGYFALLCKLLAAVVIIFSWVREESSSPMAAGEQPNNKPQITALVSATRGARRMGAIPILDNILKTCRTNSQTPGECPHGASRVGS